MADAVGDELAFFLKAATFSANRHQNQRRKGVDAPPYINHPLDVAYILANVGGVTDATTLVAAILHDTIEDTSATAEEVETNFGRKVRLLVEEVTDDKSLPDAERKRLQIEHAPNLSPHAKEIKIADKISNILEITHNPPADWSPEDKREYIEWADRVVAGCRGASQRLEQRFDEVLKDSLLSIGMDRIE